VSGRIDPGAAASRALWANCSFWEDPDHVEVLRQFAAFELQKPEALQIVHRGGAFQLVPGGPVQSLHWSRMFEWPWAYLTAGFAPGDLVLDAGGGDAPFQFFAAREAAKVVNVDLSRDYLERISRSPLFRWFRNISLEPGDLRKLAYLDGTFDKVSCLSTLEHIDEPEACVAEMVRVLKPGGIMVLSMDVASYARWNHTIDAGRAAGILRMVGLGMPPEPPDVLSARFKEIRPGPDEPGFVDLKVLCAKVVKS
jgi:ubiquinone/menaquinone biosynthesis C-methylase UbiE